MRGSTFKNNKYLFTSVIHWHPTSAEVHAGAFSRSRFRFFLVTHTQHKHIHAHTLLYSMEQSCGSVENRDVLC